MSPEPILLVALHDIEPATFERAALLRDWLDDLGVSRVTLLVIPARDLHPLADRRPEVVTWLLERAARGDAIAQHGFRHAQTPPARWPPHPFSAIAHESPEFVGLNPDADGARPRRRAAHPEACGNRAAGLRRSGYAYTPQLRESLRTRFQWWAEYLGGASDARRSTAAFFGPSRSGSPRCGPCDARSLPALLRVGSRMAGPTLRIDLHPQDLDRGAYARPRECASARNAPPRLRHLR